MTFEEIVRQKIEKIREELAQNTNTCEFRLDIEASGRVNDGTVSIRYTLGASYSGSNASGGRVDPVVEEYIRRVAWAKTNDALCLPAPDTQDEIPF